MTLVAIAMFVTRVIGPEQPQIDTKLRGGLRTRIVVVLPTTMSRQFRDAARAAIDSVREQTAREGHMFETIGVSDNWAVRQGIDELFQIGTFDEIIAGRNWLNHGVEDYISNLGGRAVVPQIVVVSQAIEMDSLPFEYGSVRELKRAAGMGEILAWAATGFRVGEVASAGQ